MKLEHLLPDYISGALDEGTASEIRRRIDSDEVFRAEYERVKSTLSLLEASKPSPEEDPNWGSFLVGINEKIDSQAAVPGGFDVSRFLPWKVIVPAIAAVGVVLFVVLSLPSSENEIDSLIHQDEIARAFEHVDTDQIPTVVELQELQMMPDAVIEDEAMKAEVLIDQNELNESLEYALFEGVGYDQLLSASQQFVPEEELIVFLTDEQFDKLMSEYESIELL